MENITPQQKRKLEKILKLGEAGLPALLEYMFELEEMIQERNDVDMKIIKASVTNILKDMKGDKGDSYILTDKDKEDISYSIRELFDDTEIANKAMSLIDKKAIVKQVVSEIVIPKAKDGNTPEDSHLIKLIKPLIPKIDTKEIEGNAVQKAVAELIPLIPKIYSFTDVRNAFEVFSDEEKLKMSAIYKLEETIDEIKKNVENSYTRVISNNRNLSNLLDVNLSGLTTNQSIKWDGVQWIPYTPGGGGGGAVDSVNGLTGVVSIGLQSVTGVGATTTIESTFSGGLITNQVKANSSAGLLLEANNATDIGLLGAGNTANVAWYGSHTFAGNLIVDTDTLYVDASTNRVGLGLTSATHQLHVRGAGQATANLTDAGATGATIFLQDTGASNSNGGAVIFGANGQSWSAIKGIYTSGAGNGLGDLVISTRRLSADTALTEAIRVTSGGNMTIGSPFVVSANSQFSIRTNTNLNFAITGFNGAPEMFSINDAFNAYTELRVNGSPLLLNGASAGNIQMVIGGGSVGVNTTTMTRGILEVVQRTNTSSSGVAVVNVAGSASGRFWVDASNVTRIDANAAGSGNVFINDTGLRVVAGTLVGIGTTPTTHTLTILNPTTATVLSLASSIVSAGSPVTFSLTGGPALVMTAGTSILSSTNGGFAIINGASTATTPVYAFRNATTTGIGTPSSGSTEITFTCGGTERARVNSNGITSSGSFSGGIGGSAAAVIINGQRWQLASSGTAGDLTLYNNSGAGPVKIQFSGLTASFPSIENVGANLLIRSANATNATRVAIGASTYDAMLHITSSSATTVGEIIRLASTPTADAWQIQDFSGTTRLKINSNFVFFPTSASTGSAPTYVTGGMYFDTTLNKLRIGGATAWETVTSV